MVEVVRILGRNCGLMTTTKYKLCQVVMVASMAMETTMVRVVRRLMKLVPAFYNGNKGYGFGNYGYGPYGYGNYSYPKI